MQQMQLQQQMFNNQLYSMNPALYSLFPYGIPQLMNYQLYL
jgi:hypothetical protein